MCHSSRLAAIAQRVEVHLVVSVTQNGPLTVEEQCTPYAPEDIIYDDHIYSPQAIIQVKPACAPTAGVTNLVLGVKACPALQKKLCHLDVPT